MADSISDDSPRSPGSGSDNGDGARPRFGSLTRAAVADLCTKWYCNSDGCPFGKAKRCGFLKLSYYKDKVKEEADMTPLMMNCGHFLCYFCAIEKRSMTGVQYKCTQMVQNVAGAVGKCDFSYDSSDIPKFPFARYLYDPAVQLEQRGVVCDQCSTSPSAADAALAAAVAVPPPTVNVPGVFLPVAAAAFAAGVAAGGKQMKHYPRGTSFCCVDCSTKAEKPIVLCAYCHFTADQPNLLHAQHWKQRVTHLRQLPRKQDDELQQDQKDLLLQLDKAVDDTIRIRRGFPSFSTVAISCAAAARRRSGRAPTAARGASASNPVAKFCTAKA
ncbi:hypothetical protein PFISCL1PPCAC_8790 [Pristionchus fissidentatus]|uniref:RING-type domain-containing protein n=1 Tax=Pristionchus fissidentatus TaxID=1538716 RepID=A0AAV5VDY8_9BILA|nr:hypothetical protein PFISCL1PPCAC_8790 [Pristionchus fissidentatus]